MMNGSNASTLFKFNMFQRSQKSFKKRLHSVLESCLERFECHKEDEYQFTSPDFVEGIPPFACEFASQSCYNHLLAAADEDGRVVIYDTNSMRKNSVVKEWSAHKNAIFDITWSSSDPRLVTASGDQSAALWDIRTGTCLSSFKQHRCSLKSVSYRPRDSHVFATGARDGSIMMWDDRSNKKGKDLSQVPVVVISEAHVDPKKKTQPKRRRKLAPDLPTIDSSHSVSVVLFQKEDTLLSAGAADGIVKLWDLRMLKTSKTSSRAPSHQFPYAGTSNRKRGFSSLALSSSRTQMFASCTDSVIYEYDLSGMLGLQPISRYRSHMNSTFFVRATVSPNDLFLLSGSSDNLAYIWKIGEPESTPMTLVGHEAEVTSVAWCPQDFTKIVTCSDDNTMRMWKMSSNTMRSNDGQTSIIGKAERCDRQALLNSQGNSEQSTSSQPSQSSRSSVDSSASISSNKTGDPSPHPSPMPSSTKKRKFSLRDWVTTTPSPSRHHSPISPSKRNRSMSTPSSSETKASRKDATVGTGRKRNCDSDSTNVDARKRVKVTKEESSSQSGKATLSVSSVSDESSSKEECEKVKGQDPSTNNDPASTTAGTAVDSKAGQKHICTVGKSNKENTVRDKKSTSPSKKSALGQRSPLKDDIPMNRASPSVSHPAKKNLASCFPEPSKPTQDYDQCCDAVEKRNKETKQQNPGKCFKDKKVDKLHKAVKRRNSARAGTIEGYFLPLLKRHKSET